MTDSVYGLRTLDLPAGGQAGGSTPSQATSAVAAARERIRKRLKRSELTRIKQTVPDVKALNQVRQLNVLALLTPHQAPCQEAAKLRGMQTTAPCLNLHVTRIAIIAKIATSLSQAPWRTLSQKHTQH